MSIRQEFVADRAMKYADICKQTPPDPYTVEIIYNRTGELPYQIVTPDGRIQAGDHVVHYKIDLSKGEQIEAANDLFNSVYYVNTDITSTQEVWPDEREIIDKILPKDPHNVLEICCGNGRVTRYLQKPYNTVTGIDNNERSIAYATMHTDKRIKYEVADAANLSAADETFALTACFENSLGVMHARRHIVVGELLRVCRPGGKVVFGLREAESVLPDGFHIYTTDGYIEIAQTFTKDRFTQLIETLPPIVRGQIANVTYEDGIARPWGGVQFFAILTKAG